MKGKRKKRPVTLIEIMIVILLIGLIGGALAFNMRGSMDKGKVFKSEQNASRVYDSLMMEYAKGTININEIVGNKEAILKILNESPLVKDAEKILKDGWGEELQIVAKGDNDLDVYSQRLRNSQNEHASN